MKVIIYDWLLGLYYCEIRLVSNSILSALILCQSVCPKFYRKYQTIATTITTAELLKFLVLYVQACMSHKQPPTSCISWINHKLFRLTVLLYLHHQLTIYLSSNIVQFHYHMYFKISIAYSGSEMVRTMFIRLAVVIK